MTSPTLGTLLNDIVTTDKGDIEINNLALDSRLVKPGDLFFALKGTHLDGNQFIKDAIQKGAQVVLTDSDIKSSEGSVPIISIPGLNKKIGLIASRFYNAPSKQMKVVGITGTNGKTSTSHFIAAILHELNKSCGVIGTLGSGLYGHVKETGLTTPDAITLQKTLAEFLKEDAKYTAMEVSSHSIDQGRINGIDFAVSVFTNLTRDHLDYHHTMEAYGNTKKKLFESDASRYAVINSDDAFGKQIISELRDKKLLYVYGMNEISYRDVPVVYAENIHLDLDGIRAEVHSPWGMGELRCGLIGKFNLSNLLAVITTLCLLEIPLEAVLSAIAKLKPVDGRMQTLGGKDKPLVVVDYSHTPDALEKALAALRHHCQGKLYCVFGCGGDRDRGKRPIMAKMAEQYSDQVIVTDDNPRTEDAEQIFNDIRAGFAHPEKILMQHDRAQAIRETIQMAQPGDCILIAGKGAETYQIIGTTKNPFSDVEQVELSLKK